MKVHFYVFSSSCLSPSLYFLFYLFIIVLVVIVGINSEMRDFIVSLLVV